MSQLTLGNVLPALAQHVSTAFALQITDPQHPDYGGIVYSEWGLAAAGSDVIQIGPGATVHRMWAMRDAEPAPHHVSVLMTFVAPIDHCSSIRVWHGAI